jgi:hypothetical protein
VGTLCLGEGDIEEQDLKEKYAMGCRASMCLEDQWLYSFQKTNGEVCNTVLDFRGL